MTAILISIDEVKERIGLSETTIWRIRKAGNFPKPVEVSPNRIAWVEQEVEDWLAERINKRKRY